MNFALHKLKKRIAAAITRASDVATFVGVVMIGGIGSSWYMVSAGSSLTTRVQGPWVTWTAEGRGDADPYTRAHFARTGTLNLSTEIAATYLASTDSDGLRLHSSCEYTVQGREIEANWWSLTALDERGRLIPNPSDRFTYTADTVAISPDGTFTISLARDARPGNWLPTGGAGRLVLALVVLEGSTSFVNGTGEIALPEVKRLGCR